MRGARGGVRARFHFGERRLLRREHRAKVRDGGARFLELRGGGGEGAGVSRIHHRRLRRHASVRVTRGGVRLRLAKRGFGGVEGRAKPRGVRLERSLANPTRDEFQTQRGGGVAAIVVDAIVVDAITVDAIVVADLILAIRILADLILAIRTLAVLRIFAAVLLPSRVGEFDERRFEFRLERRRLGVESRGDASHLLRLLSRGGGGPFRSLRRDDERPRARLQRPRARLRRLARRFRSFRLRSRASRGVFVLETRRAKRVRDGIRRLLRRARPGAVFTRVSRRAYQLGRRLGEFRLERRRLRSRRVRRRPRVGERRRQRRDVRRFRFVHANRERHGGRGRRGLGDGQREDDRI